MAFLAVNNENQYQCKMSRLDRMSVVRLDARGGGSGGSVGALFPEEPQQVLRLTAAGLRSGWRQMRA